MPGAVPYPFVVSTLPWASLPGQWNLTVGLKATYTLAPSAGEPALSDQKDGLHEDVPFDASPHASLYSPSDFVPFKARADVLLVGQAHAPSAVPTESLLVRLRVGDFAKALRVTGDRAWVDTPQGPRPSAPRPFASAALRYERALRRGENLAGVTAGDTSRPPAAIDLAPEEGPAETPGFGPIAASWRAACDPRVQDVLIWSQRLRTTPRQGPPPPNADPTLFNSAPRDQQPAEIHPGAAIVLDHLHPRFPRLETRIPSIVPRAFHVDTSGAPREVPVRIDTVWIDTEREVFVVSWRGFLPSGPEVVAGPVRVVVGAHARGQAATFEEMEALARGVAAPQAPKPAGRAAAVTVDLGAAMSAARAMPFPAASSKAKNAAPGTSVLPAFGSPIGAPAPFPLATPGAAAPSGPVEGAPWAGVPAAPVPKPTEGLGSTMPLGASLVEAVAKARAKALAMSAEGASTPTSTGRASQTPPPPSVPPPAFTAPAASVEAPAAAPPRPPSVAPPAPQPAEGRPPSAPPPGQPLWRVDEPPAPVRQPEPPAKPGRDARQEVYGAFTRKKR